MVSLVPSVTESLFELGCGATLAGITDFCVHPADGVHGLARLGGTRTPDLAAIRRLAPDLIIASREENRREDLQALAAEGFRVWLTFPRTVRQALDLLGDVIHLFRLTRQGLQLAVLEKAFEWAEQAAQAAEPTAVFCPIWRQPAAGEGEPEWWMTANQGTYLHDALRLCGARNVFASRERLYPLAADLGRQLPEDPGDRDTRYPCVTPEEVAACRPEVILLPDGPYPFGEADLRAWEAFPEIPAVLNSRVYLVDGSLLTWPGIRLARLLSSELPLLIGGARQEVNP